MHLLLVICARLIRGRILVVPLSQWLIVTLSCRLLPRIIRELAPPSLRSATPCSCAQRDSLLMLGSNQQVRNV